MSVFVSWHPQQHPVDVINPCRFGSPPRPAGRDIWRLHGGYTAGPPGPITVQSSARRWASPGVAPAAACRSCKTQARCSRTSLVDTVRGNVHHQPRARQRGASVQPAYQVGRQGDRLVGHRQRQFARMQEKASPSGRTISSLITRSSAALTSAFGPLKSINGAV